MGLLGVCQQHTTDIPFGPWRGIWRDFFGITSSMSLNQQIENLSVRLEELLPGSKADLPLWADPLGLPIPQTDAVAMLTAEARQARFFTMVRRCFQAAAIQQPLMLIAEGLHWADQSSLALLDEVTAHIENSALFVAITFRAEDDLSLDSLKRPFCQSIHVNDLSATHARQLLKHLVGADELPQAVEQQLGLRDREGRDSVVNPLFLEEALNVMTSAGVLKVNGRIQVDETKLAQMQVPDTIHGLLLARLDRLPPATRDLLQVASVIGRQFELDSLTALSQRLPRQLMLDLLNDLTTADMTRLVTADPEWIYLFQHAMTHEVAYESLPFARRQELHALVADWIRERHEDNLRPYHPILAFHFSRAGIHEDGLHFSLQAAEDARAIFANKEAVELYNLAEGHLRALGIEDRWETAVDLLLARTEAKRFLGAFNEAVTDTAQAENILSNNGNDSARKLRIQNLLAELKCRQGSFEEARKIVKRVINNLEQDLPLDELARTYQWDGFAASSLGDFDDALKSLKIAEDLCVQVSNNVRMAGVLENTAFVYFMQKKLEFALEAMQKSVNLSRDVSIPANAASSLSNIALIQFQLGRASEALVSLNDAIELVRDTSRNFLATALSNKAEILAYLGNFDEAKKVFDEAIHLFTAMDDQQGLLDAYLLLGYEYHCALEQWDEADYYFDRAANIINANDGEFSESKARLLIGNSQIALQKGQLTIANDAISKAEKLVLENSLSWWRPVVDYLNGKILIKEQNIASARESFQSGIAAIENEGCPDYLPLLQFELVKLEKDSEQMGKLLLACIESLINRSRFVDKKYCIQQIKEYPFANLPVEIGNKLSDLQKRLK